MEKSNSDLFNMKVSLTDTSQIAIHLDYIQPSKIKDSLENINEMFYANLLASVVKHCIETSQKLNDDIKVLIERI
jgi:hypothetical protein|tara:strand:+ start:395 stop:619 length:225 start_codon:yes stop_codon:yes gene_type:complete